MRNKTWSLWVLAFLLTALSAVYQTMTGPSYPVKGTVVVDASEIAFRLPRSHRGEGDAEVKIRTAEPTLSGTLEYRRYRSHDPWSQQTLEREGDYLIAHIPHQPPAGKVMYRIHLSGGAGSPAALTPEPVIIRFGGSVPDSVLWSHIVIIFAGMLLSTRTGFEALCKGTQTYKLTLWTIACLAIGGFVLGPVVQKYAFGAFWTGWPFGHDLTDNKIAVAMFFWLLALWRTRQNRAARGWALVASLVTLAVWLIPHSLLGSELDYTQTPQQARRTATAEHDRILRLGELGPSVRVGLVVDLGPGGRAGSVLHELGHHAGEPVVAVVRVGGAGVVVEDRVVALEARAGRALPLGRP